MWPTTFLSLCMITKKKCLERKENGMLYGMPRKNPDYKVMKFTKPGPFLRQREIKRMQEAYKNPV